MSFELVSHSAINQNHSLTSDDFMTTGSLHVTLSDRICHLNCEIRSWKNSHNRAKHPVRLHTSHMDAMILLQTDFMVLDHTSTRTPFFAASGPRLSAALLTSALNELDLESVDLGGEGDVSADGAAQRRRVPVSL